MEIFTLDLRNITGKITKKTPRDIIDILTKYSDIKINEKYLLMDDYIDKINIALDNIEYPNSNNINSVELFISTEVEEWDEENRNIALNHMISFYIDKIPKISSINFNYGNKTNEDPLKYNICILYRLCKYFQIETNINTTIDIMAKSIRLMIDGGPKVLKEQLIESIKNLDTNKLIELYNSGLVSLPLKPLIEASPQIPINEIISNHFRKDYSEDDYNKCREYLFNTSNLLCRIIPSNHLEAIILTAVRFGINISESINPTTQFLYISRESFCGKTNINYIPINDHEFMKKYLKNPHFYNVKTYWTECLSQIYDKHTLEKFILAEGYSYDRISLRDPTSLLKDIRNRPNIFFGLNPYCKENYTIINHEHIDNINIELLLSIGIINKPNTLYYITIEELTSWFNDRKIFLDPFNLSNIEMENIKKLKMKIDSISKEKTYLSKIYQKCLNSIIETENISSSLTEKAKELSNKVRMLIDIEKDKVKVFWNYVIELALYTRGWKIENDDMPLKSAKTNYNCKKQSEVEINTTIATIKILEQLKLLPLKIQDYINILPVIKFNKDVKLNTLIFGENINKKIYTDHKHKLIDIFHIIHDENNENSCIRTNSNWILISAIYYSRLCGFEVDISLNDLDEIS